MDKSNEDLSKNLITILPQSNEPHCDPPPPDHHDVDPYTESEILERILEYEVLAEMRAKWR